MKHMNVDLGMSLWVEFWIYYLTVTMGAVLRLKIKVKVIQLVYVVLRVYIVKILN